jgi:AcrR family transcriptional regulator
MEAPVIAKTQRQLQGEQTRQQIIEAATQLFVRKGFYGTSIADLARAVGLTKGALYHHFENKDAIFFAVIETVRSTWHEAVVRDVLKVKDAPSRMAVLIDAHSRLVSENKTLCLVLNGLITEMEGVNPAFLTALLEIYTELANFIGLIVKKGQEAGQVRPDLDAELIAISVVGMLREIGCSQMFNRMDVDCVALTETLKQLLLDGLQP